MRAAVVRTYAPVGAGQERDRASFGEALAALDDDPDNPAVAHAVGDIATELLAEDGKELPPFVATSMRACVAAARRESIAA